MKPRAWVAVVTFGVLAGCGPEPAPTVPKPVAPPDAAVAQPTPAPAADPAPPGLRLPPGVTPTRYALSLELDADKEPFAGTVAIDVTFADARDHVWLHADDLVISTATIDGAAMRPLSTSKGDLVGFGFDPVEPGAHRLELAFTGHTAARSMSGLFRQQDGGKWYLYSQFEALAARKAFPCFDEPAFKVPWTVTLTTPAGQKAYSNGALVDETTAADGRVVRRFAETPAIPSYLVAFAVGPFEEVDVGPVGRGKVPARILTPAGRAAEAAGAREEMPRIVAALEDYFDMPLPFEKLDSVAVPHFFGAMENPGLITYDAGILLATKDADDVIFRRRLVAIAGHEIAHQWFGNYVTLAWWDDLWLNESFATWMADKIATKLDPDANAAISARHNADEAMLADARLGARPLYRPVRAVGDIESAFDAIAYSKGGAVLTMFERWIGEDRFRDGVRAYMKAHARGSATSADFLGALEQASTTEVGGKFRAYLEQAGVPVVHVALDCARGAPPTVRLRQQRLVEFGAQAPDDRWPIRACVRYGGAGKGAAKEACTDFAEAEATIPLDTKTCPAWVTGNAGGAGYYRVAYDDDLGARLARHLRRVPAVERIALGSDVVALLGAGVIRADDALGFVGPLLATRDEHDLAAAVEIVGATESLVDDAHRSAWRRWVIKKMGTIARAASLAPPRGESRTARSARVELLELVGLAARDGKLAARARKLVDPWLAGKGDAPPDLEVVLSLAAGGGDARLFDAIVAKAKTTDDKARRTALLGALGRFTDPALVARAHEIVMGGEFDIFQVGAVLQAQMDSPEGARAVGVLVRARWDELTKVLPKMGLPYLVYMQGAVCDAPARAEVESFVRPRVDQLPNGEKLLTDALAGIDACIARREALSGDLADLLAR